MQYRGMTLSVRGLNEQMTCVGPEGFSGPARATLPARQLANAFSIELRQRGRTVV